MAAHLVKAGFDVTGYNLSPERCSAWSRRAAGRATASPRPSGTPT